MTVPITTQTDPSYHDIPDDDESTTPSIGEVNTAAANALKPPQQSNLSKEAGKRFSIQGNLF